jgi:hypothetical protein
MPSRSPLRTRAYVWEDEMFRTSATSARVRKRSSAMVSSVAADAGRSVVVHRPAASRIA